MEKIKLPDFKCKIGDKVKIKNGFQTPNFMLKKIYVVDDIIYSIVDNCWSVVLYYYSNSIDSGTTTIGLEEFYEEFEKIED